MPILTRFGRLLSIAVVASGLISCGQGSPEYRHIKSLPYTQWNAYASTLPIEQRLDLHKEIRERSGHNPRMTIRFSFQTQPDETYRAIVRRLESGDRSRYYLDILYAIDGRRNFRICEQRDRAIVQKFLSGTAEYPHEEKFQPEFYTC